MAGNLPPGVSAGTAGAPWNQDPPPTCDECGGVYTDDGHQPITVEVDGETREEPCPHDGMVAADKEDADRERHAVDEERLHK